MSASILLIEDEPAIQQLVSLVLKQAGHSIQSADSAETGLELIKEKLPDLLLIDWMLPGISGAEFTKRLRQDERTKQLPIILLTARSEEADKVKGLDLGADDYITKPFSPKELQARIQALLRRRAPQLSNDSIEIYDLHLDPSTHRITVKNQILDVSPIEFKLLHYFMTHPERVYSRAQLLDKVWGDHMYLEERTVDVNIRRLRTLLAPHGLSDLLQTVRGAGYRLSNQENES